MNTVAAPSLSDPAGVVARLDEIDAQLADLQNEVEGAAFSWFQAKRDREQTEATAYVRAEGNHSERKQAAVQQAGKIGIDEEAAWEGKRALLKVLETRSMIGTALLKAQGRGL